MVQSRLEVSSEVGQVAWSPEASSEEWPPTLVVLVGTSPVASSEGCRLVASIPAVQAVLGDPLVASSGTMAEHRHLVRTVLNRKVQTWAASSEKRERPDRKASAAAAVAPL